MKGSHNTLTYGKPVHFWGWFLLPIWRCQSRSIAEQLSRGVRAFDIRFFPRYNSHQSAFPSGVWCSGHGPVAIRLDPEGVIDRISRSLPAEETAYVRLILEKGDYITRADFSIECRRLEDAYPNIVFFGGNLKSTWERLYSFRNPKSYVAEKCLNQYVGSMKSKWGKVCPWLWWLFNKNKAPEPTESFPIVFEDFV